MQVVRRGYIELQIYQNKDTKGKQKGAYGYAKGVTFDLGVTQKGSILVWGYVSNKRLRTPDLVCPIFSLPKLT
jgi:hypothetical protein